MSVSEVSEAGEPLAPLLHPVGPQHPPPPHPTIWHEKTPLSGLFAITMKAFFSSFARIYLCIPEGAFITPCPGHRQLPPSDPPAQKGSLVRHMQPAPPDTKTRHSPWLSTRQHECHSPERTTLDPGLKSLTKCMQLGGWVQTILAGPFMHVHNQKGNFAFGRSGRCPNTPNTT